MLGQGYTRTIKRLHVRWAVAVALVLLLGIGGGVLIERQAVVVSCVQALDGYRDGLTLLSDVSNADPTNQAVQQDLFARAGAIRAQREPAETRCRGSQ